MKSPKTWDQLIAEQNTPTDEEHMAAGSLLAIGKMLHEWGYPLDKALRGLKIAYEIAALPEPCTCRAERDRELCQRKDRCAAVHAFVERDGGDSSGS